MELKKCILFVFGEVPVRVTKAWRIAPLILKHYVGGQLEAPAALPTRTHWRLVRLHKWYGRFGEKERPCREPNRYSLSGP